MSIEGWIQRWKLAQVFYDWQTLIAGVLAVLAAWRTIRATTELANREVKASQDQTAVAQKQIETTLQLERQCDALRERDRTDRAEVVVFRLSGWLSEVGSAIKAKSEQYETFRTHNATPASQPHQIVTQWKLNMAAGIESVMSDLHYLERGAGDVAKLDLGRGSPTACGRGLSMMASPGRFLARNRRTLRRNSARLVTSTAIFALIDSRARAQGSKDRRQWKSLVGR